MSGVRAVPHAKAQPLPLVLSALPTPMVSRKRHESAMNRVTDRGVRNGSAASCQRESKGERVLCPFDLREHTRCVSRGNSLTFGDAYVREQDSFVGVPFLYPPLQVRHTRVPASFEKSRYVQRSSTQVNT